MMNDFVSSLSIITLLVLDPALTFDEDGIKTGSTNSVIDNHADGAGYEYV